MITILLDRRHNEGDDTMAKKFSPRQEAKLANRRAERETRRYFGERYEELDGPVVQRDMREEMAGWY
jgi:hypothetical protein